MTFGMVIVLEQVKEATFAHDDISSHQSRIIFWISVKPKQTCSNWINNQRLDKPNTKTIQKQVAANENKYTYHILRIPVFNRFHKHKTCWIASDQLFYIHTNVTSHQYRHNILFKLCFVKHFVANLVSAANFFFSHNSCQWRGEGKLTNTNAPMLQL